MKLKAPVNENYAAQVVRIRNLVPLKGLDNLVAAPLMGYQALVSRETPLDGLFLVFTAETQLSEEYTRENNLYRHSYKNRNDTAQGYLEDNRRVKAITLRGHRSDALVMPLSSLSYIPGGDWTQLKEGDTFDEFQGHLICNKYQLRIPGAAGTPGLKNNHRVGDASFPKHFDTANFFRTDPFNRDDYVIVTQKLHGTSVRVGNIPVERKLTWKERLAQKLGIPVSTHRYEYVYGSRNVTKDVNDPDAVGFYGSDVHVQVGSQLKGLLQKDMVVYAEIVGWVPGTSKPIQQGYTYDIPEGNAELYVYRITTVNGSNQQHDWSWDAVKEYCSAQGIKTVPDLDRVFGINGEAGAEFIRDSFLDQRLNNKYPQALRVPASLVDEGVCLRREGITPTVVKAKSPIFLRHETKELDKGEVDIESSEG